MFKKISSFALIASMVPMLANAQTMSLEDRVAELEANQSMNIFNFSGTMFMRYDNIMKVDETKPTATDYTDLSYLRMKFQLNMDANISKNIKFYSRLTTSKSLNTYYQQQASAPTDLTASNSFQGSDVYLEKAYADLTIPDSNFVVSVGRLPTVDGQP